MLLKRLFSRARKSQPTHRIPDGQRVYAVGDVHGRLDLLDDLIRRIGEDDAERGAARTKLIFLGDLVDRGPDSRGVIERVRALQAAGNLHCLMGNHEEVFLRSIDGDIQALRLFIRIGGRETILSYGVSEEDYNKADFEELAEILAARVPPEHVAFISSFEDHIEIGDYLFVHAGIRPGVPIAEQASSDLRWIRDSFLDHEGDHGRRVVHGHSIRQEAELLPNRIGIDTGAYATDRLSAVGLEGGAQWFLSTLDRK